MKTKKGLIISIIIVILFIISISVYFIFMKEDKKTTLTLIEKQWIEKNKNKMIDLGIVNDIPVFNYSGKGLFFDFLESFEENTNLEFNKLSYKITDEINTEYAFKVVDEVSNKDIVVYKDNYALVTNQAIKYNSLNEINNLTIGVINSDLDKANTYLANKNNITFKTYESYDDLLNDFSNNQDDNEVNAIVIPKNTYLKEIISNNLYIAYNITEMSKNYVISLGNIDNLNDIIKKYYIKWSKENYEKLYNDYLTSNYFSFKNVDEKEIVKFRSKRYLYGFVANKPYDVIVNEKLYGINSSFMKAFSKLANIEISYKNYKDYNSLITDFNENKLDLLFDSNTNNTYPMDVYNTVSTYNEKVLILSHIKNDIDINSLNSLFNQEIMVLKGSQIATVLNDNKINIKQYNNINSLLKNIKRNSLIAIDYNTYRYYANNEFANYKIDYEFELSNDYKFIIRDIKDNKLFSDFFNFYLGFVNEKKIINDSFVELISVDKKANNTFLYVIIGGLLVVIGGLIVVLTRRQKVKKPVMSKENKLKYIDQLTSLKNRNYLNDNIEAWDNSEVYPQTIVIIDLNNIAYINDNYGHNEGDKVIREAANILIRNQIENSDIIRTNGNEFLIYLVGYDEKQVVSYIRKLSKDFKEITHGFGAAFGYSMINDAIKTIDDAVNEATLAMRENKEGFNN